MTRSVLRLQRYPPGSRRRREAEEAEAVAEADLAYRRVSPEGLSDTAEDIRRSLAGEGIPGKKENTILVQSADEADLVVEVVGRRSGKTLPTQLRADRYWVSFVIEFLQGAPSLRYEVARTASIGRRMRKALNSSSYGNELWEFDDDELMRRRLASIKDAHRAMTLTRTVPATAVTHAR
jgi:hypothetical protein